MLNNIIIAGLSLFWGFNTCCISKYNCTDLFLADHSLYNDSDIVVIKDILYGDALNNMGEMTELKLDIYMPPPDSGQLNKYPLIILAHGGGFRHGNKNKPKELSTLLAAKGYVVSSIDYRLGRKEGSGKCNDDYPDLKRAIYRAVQDLNASIRFLKHNASAYGIDTNYIFIGGSSAGGVTCLWSQFFSQTDFNSWIPDAEKNLGGINSSGNDIIMSTGVNGICNLWGCISDTAYIKTSNAIPVISFHGDHDLTIPIDTGRIKHCTNPLALKLHGSRAIYYKLKSLNICSELNVQIEGHHGVYNSKYIAEKTASFFKSIISGNCLTVYNINMVKPGSR